MIRCYTVPEIWHVTDKCYFSFWANFCPFTPLTAQKIKILKKGKKTLEISSFDICVPKIMIRCMVPEIWYTTDRQTDGWIKWHIEVPHLKISVNILKFLGYIYKKMVLFYKNILIYNLLIKLNSKNQSFKKNNFNCYLAAPWPTLEHYQGGQPHSPNVNHCVLHIWPKGHQEPNNEVWSLSLTECLAC